MTAHTDVGAYSMGLLEERDRRAFERHLAGCASCAAELTEFSSMAALLRGAEFGNTGLRSTGRPTPRATRRAGRTSPSSCTAAPRSSGTVAAGRLRWRRQPASC